jgi:mitochondrial import inner membrane translocase subunit TIM50
MGGPAAATASGAGQAAASTTSPPSASESSRSETIHPSSVTDAPMDANANIEEPMARNPETAMPGISEAGRPMQAEAETATSEQPPRPIQPNQPLPDLRQGIPSTFAEEFGRQAQQRAAMEDELEQERQQRAAQGLDLTYEETEGQQQRDRGERDYDRSAYETSLDRRRAKFANYMYAGILLATVGGGLYLSRPFGSSEQLPKGFDSTNATSWSPASMWERIRARCGDQMGYYTEPTFPKLLPEMPEGQRQPFTLVLSLEDLMIHSTWDREHGYRTAKRPGIDYFIRYLSQYYELVLFTSVPIAMADPVIKKLDPYHFIMWPLGREATKYEGGDYVKDLAYLNRPLSKTLIIDTHAPHVKNQPENAIIIPKWSGNPKDEHTKDLVSLIPFLEYVATMGTEDVRTVLASFKGTSIPEEFARREAIAREKFNRELAASNAGRPRHSLGSLAKGFGIGSSAGMGGGMVTADGKSVSDGFREGKMLSDQIREQGQKQYEFIEKQIQEHGAQWLKEEEEEQKRMMEAQVKDMKKSTFSWFGGGSKEA